MARIRDAQKIFDTRGGRRCAKTLGRQGEVLEILQIWEKNIEEKGKKNMNNDGSFTIVEEENWWEVVRKKEK